jgi:hypothetical protein
MNNLGSAGSTLAVLKTTVETATIKDPKKRQSERSSWGIGRMAPAATKQVPA